ncbi:hypothetical protein E3U23_01930 [Erythrobacter litoralis]|uniref:biliverdin-producing heme oxygenase n=1 Tax=Erythrobacter litoralis TaxID=39960 RepID=UPI0024354F50|nr:biliverdin-producing heme oxygenase [Erythrobacter litoralis]MDG6077956.1 hypothetical protein [Erythrobacter litoralis]
MQQLATEKLRDALRRHTREEHDRLDATLGDLPVRNDAQYTRFLRIQYRARKPIEAWFERLDDDAIAAPPPQCGLIAEDLRVLDIPTPNVQAPFELDKSGWIGAAWVLAGSSLGNRMLLKQRRRRDLDGPVGFLASEDMAAYFHKMLSFLQKSHSSEHQQNAIEGAKAVFARFESVAERELAEEVE